MRQAIALLAAALTVAVAGGVRAEESVRIVNIGHGYYAGPLYAALRERVFEKHGLRPEVTSVKGGALALQAVLSQQTDVGILSYEHLLTVAAQGKQVVAIFKIASRPLNNVVVNNELAARYAGAGLAEKVRALRGARVAVPSPNGSGEKMLRILARKYGLSLPGDVSMVYLGSEPGAYLAAFQKKLIDAALPVEPAGVMIQQAGEGRTLVNFMAGEVPEFSDLIFMTVAAHPDTIRERPEFLRRVVAAFAEAQRILKDPARGRAIMAREYPNMSPEANAEAYQVMNAIWSEDGRMTDRQGQAVYDYLQPAGEARVDIGRTYTNAFLPR